MAAPTKGSAPRAVPIISDRQNKKVLLKKKKKKQVHRNLLVTPFQDYWPELLPNEEERLDEVFKKLFETEQNVDNIKMKEKDLLISKRKKWLEFLVIGVNDVSRCVKKGSVVAVLLAADVDPKFLLQHLATLCGIARVPVLLSSSLRMYTKTLLGFCSLAIGIKKIAVESKTNSLHDVYELIKILSENYSPPPSLQQFNTSADKSCHSKNEKSVPLRKKPIVASHEPTPSTDLYLYRTSCESRVFVPESQKVDSDAQEEKPKPKQGLGDFLSLGGSESDEPMETDEPIGISYTVLNPVKKRKPGKSQSSFVPFKYMKVKPNPNKKSR